MNKLATVRVDGNAGAGVAENIMSGTVIVDGDASQSAAATGRGGLLVIKGSASARCGISMKGVDIVVHGSIGHVGGFMAQKGCLVVCGDAGDGLGDSIYEAHVYVRGEVAGLGADCIEKEMRDEHVTELRGCSSAAEADFDLGEFTRYGSARELYNFQVDNAGEYCDGRSSISARRRGSTRSSRTSGAPACASRRSSTATRSTRSTAWRARGSTTSAASAPSARSRTSTTCSSSAPASRATRWRATASSAPPTSTLGTRFARNPIQLDIPITIAGMSFGALSAPAKEALGRGASAMGTSTTTGDGGMLPEEREHSTKLVYQMLPSRYGMNPDDLRKADAIEVVVGQGAKPGGGGMLIGQKISDRVAEMRDLPKGIDQRSACRHPDWTGPDDLEIKIGELREITDWRSRST